MIRMVFWRLYDVAVDLRRQIWPYERDRGE